MSLYFAVSLSRSPSTGNRGSHIVQSISQSSRRPLAAHVRRDAVPLLRAGLAAAGGVDGLLARTDGARHLTI